MKKWHPDEKDEKRQTHMNKIKHYCKCGHTLYIPKRNLFVYCDWCHRRVFQDDRCEFEYKLLRSLGKTDNRQLRKYKNHK